MAGPLSYSPAGVVPPLRPAAGSRPGLGAEEWPAGCLGYAYNLVRPAARGHRASILCSQLGAVLVFETLQDGAAYREYMTQVRAVVGGCDE